MSALASLIEQRERYSRRQAWRFHIQRIMDNLARLALIGFGIWCFKMRDQIQALLMNMLSR